MAIELIVEPRITKTWQEFLAQNPSYSIALDGYVRGKPEFDSKTRKINFNHHEDVDRLGTRSTCAQVHMSIKQGLFETFQQGGDNHANLYVNDADQDVCVSAWLLQNHERIEGKKSEPLITRLVHVTDFLDATAGSFPIDPSMSVRKELAWIFRPYTEARVSGRIYDMQEPEMRSILESVFGRISDYTMGRGGKVPLDTRYKVIGGGRNWQMIEEIGFDARSELFARGVRAFVSARQNSDETHSYSIGKMSPYINFPIVELYKELNKIEGLADCSGNCWGGGDTIGGSPRMKASCLKPSDVQKIVNETLEKYNGNGS